jgi:hypothetical protein
MDVTYNTNRNNRFNKPSYQNHVSRASININDIKYDLLKVAEIYDGLLQEGLGDLSAHMFSAYLQDLCDDRWIHSFEITEIVLKEHSYTYDINVQITNDRTPKKLKIHVGLYHSAWPALSKTMKNTDAGYVNA